MQNILLLTIAFVASVFAFFIIMKMFAFTPNTIEENESLRYIIKPDFLRNLKLISGFLAGGGTALIALSVKFPLITVIIFSAVAIYLSNQLISSHIKKKIHQRNELFEEGMLDFTVLVKNALRSGFSMPTAIEMAIRSIKGPIQEEFSEVLREYQLGMELGSALKKICLHIDSENLLFFSAAVNVTVKTGGGAADVLERIEQTILKRNEVRDKLKTMVAQSEFEALTISLAPIAAFIILWLVDPELMTPMLQTAIGWAGICVILLLEFVGFKVIKKVIAVKI